MNASGAQVGTIEDERGPVGQLGPEPWLRSPATAAVMDAITAEGGRARFVGGCVRDALLNRSRGADADIDIGTTETPDRVMGLLSAKGLTPLPTGLSHGTVRTVVSGIPYEITTLRRDVACDGRHAQVAFTTSFFEDAKRRDFTLNALSSDRDGFVFDYVDGMPDLIQGRIRFVGHPIDRIQEDYLRILRFFRFYAWYARGDADRDALSACQANTDGIDSLSAERIRGEILKTLSAPNPSDALSLMSETHVLDRILPESPGVNELRSLVLLETSDLSFGTVQVDPLRRLGCLLGGGGVCQKRVDALSFERLKLSNKESRYLLDLLAEDESRWPSPEMDRKTLLCLMLNDGVRITSDRLLLRWAVEQNTLINYKSIRTTRWRDLLDQVRNWVPPVFPVKGEDFLVRGLSGPAVGRAIQRLRTVWIDHDCQPDRNTLLRYWDSGTVE